MPDAPAAEPMMSIRQMCDQFNVTPRTLRFYEAKELITPTRQGQHRLYSRRDRARLTLILRGKHFGFSLEMIRQLLDLYSPDDSQQNQLTQVYQAAQTRLAELEQERADLDRKIVELKAELAWGAEALASRHSQTAAE